MDETYRVKQIERMTYAYGDRGSIFEYSRDGRLKCPPPSLRTGTSL